MEEEIYRHPDDYDLEHAQFEPDIDFYVSLAQRWRPRRILELGCGTGRITIPLARATSDFCESIVGLDNARPMLSAAGQKAAQVPGLPEQIRWVEADLRTWRGEQPFDVIISPCGTLCHLLKIEDQLATWRSAFDNLAPGGRFVVDVTLAEFGVFAESLEEPSRAILRIDKDVTRSRSGQQERLLRYRAVNYSVPDQEARIRYLYDEFAGSAPQRFISDYQSHVYYPRELELLFRISGFSVESTWGNYRDGPLENSSRVIVMVGAKGRKI